MSMTDYSEYIEPDHLCNPRSDRKEATWKTKDKGVVRVVDMTDNHLFNAFMISNDNDLFKEMVYRLFEQRLRQLQEYV